MNTILYGVWDRVADEPEKLQKELYDSLDALNEKINSKRATEGRVNISRATGMTLDSLESCRKMFYRPVPRPDRCGASFMQMASGAPAEEPEE